MLKIKTTNDKLLGPLQQVTGIVERRHTLPILSNVLLTASGSRLEFLATDLEVQITSRASLGNGAEGSVTAAARKLYDILRALPEDAEVSLEAKESRMTVQCGATNGTDPTAGDTFEYRRSNVRRWLRSSCPMWTRSRSAGMAPC